MVETPDIIEEHKSIYCKCCGDILLSGYSLKEKRQVIDIPPIIPIITEHRVYTTVCKCGTENTPDFPNVATARISYGERVKSMIGYFSVGQYMPMKRISETLEQLFGLSMSQGTVCNLLSKLSDQCLPIYDQIKQRVATSQVVGTDETGCRINGGKSWMWTWQTEKLTYIAASQSRGYVTVSNQFPQGFPCSTLISDSWAAQLKTPSKHKQLCMAHIQRELKYFIEQSKNRWSKKFLNLIYSALELRKYMLKYPLKCVDKKINHIITKAKILTRQNAKGPPKMHALRKRLIKYEDCLWQFLENLNVPPDNNGSERAIRNVKVKQKVSCQFRSFKGANQFAVLRSVFDTTRKNDGKAFDAFFNIALYAPE